MFTNASDASTFIFGGRARFTLTSKATGKSFTFKMDAPKDRESNQFSSSIRFVKVLDGPNNAWDGDWRFLGFVQCDENEPTSCLIAGKSGLPDAPSFKALSWALAHLGRGNIPEGLEIRHEGKCCRCGRSLTVPSSIDTGIGPECARKMGGAA